MSKFILIDKLDYKYVNYPAYAKTEQALYTYLCDKFDLVDFTVGTDNPIPINTDSILYCCSVDDDIVFDGKTYNPNDDMQIIIDDEFGGDVEAFIDYLTENNMLVVGTEFDEEFKSFMWDVVYAISTGDLNIDIDFDDLFISVHRDYDVDTAIDCVKELLED